MDMKQRKVLQDLLIKVFCNKPEWMSKVSAKHSEKDIGFFNVLFTDDTRSVPHYSICANKGFEAEDKFGNDGSESKPWVLPLSGLMLGLNKYVYNHTEFIQDQIDDPNNNEMNSMAGLILQYALFGKIEFN